MDITDLKYTRNDKTSTAFWKCEIKLFKINRPPTTKVNKTKIETGGKPKNEIFPAGTKYAHPINKIFAIADINKADGKILLAFVLSAITPLINFPNAYVKYKELPSKPSSVLE